MPWPEFQPHLDQAFPCAEGQWLAPRKGEGPEGRFRLHRESKRSFLARMMAQTRRQVNDYYEWLRSRNFVANPIHARNERWLDLFNDGLSYTAIQDRDREAASVSLSAIRKAVAEAARRTGWGRRPPRRGKSAPRA
jgi:hypothetical protein